MRSSWFIFIELSPYTLVRKQDRGRDTGGKAYNYFIFFYGKGQNHLINLAVSTNNTWQLALIIC